MQAAHRAMFAERVNVFHKNVFYLDYLFNFFMASGVIMEDNDIYLFKGGAVNGFYASKTLTIRNNHFHLAPGVRQEALWPDKMTRKLGGTFEMPTVPGQGEVKKGYWNGERYIEPEGEGAGAPTIENNRFTLMEKADRRPGNLIDLKRLVAQVKKVGETAWLRPKDPAKHLRAQVTGDGAVSLTWDESADADVVGYLIRYGRKSNSYQNPTFVGKVKSTEIKNLQPGTWYFTVVPYKEGNVECWKLSNEVQVAVGAVPE